MKIKTNKFGYHELLEKPSLSVLKNYYQKEYFQKNEGNYKKTYSESEKIYFKNKLEQKYRLLTELLPKEGIDRSILDIGAGEGWGIDFFIKKGWNCIGLDYSLEGCQQQNPHCLSSLVIGDIHKELLSQVSKQNKFDVLLLDNVLEHVLDPFDLLKTLRKLISSSGVLIVEVPNDFSKLQEYLLEQGHVSRPFWVRSPDHISYFNRKGLINLCNAAGWEVKDILADFPIDFNLLISETNYIENGSVGKACHQARVALENMLHEVSPEKTNEFYRSLADLGLGRQIIGFFGPK